MGAEEFEASDSGHLEVEYWDDIGDGEFQVVVYDDNTSKSYEGFLNEKYRAESFEAEYKVIGIPEGHWEYDVINRQIEKGDRDDEMNHRVVARDVNRNDGRLITYLHNEALQRFENMGRSAEEFESDNWGEENWCDDCDNWGEGCLCAESFEATKGMDTYAQPLEELKIKPTKTKVGILLASIVAGGLWYSNKMKE